MGSSATFVFPATVGSLVVVGLLSIRGALSVAAQIRKGTPKDNFYEDRDGKSSPETVAAFTNRPHKIALLLLSFIGLGTSIAVSVLDTFHSGSTHDVLFLENWLATAAWVS
jgi:hypothetical protein